MRREKSKARKRAHDRFGLRFNSWFRLFFPSSSHCTPQWGKKKRKRKRRTKDVDEQPPFRSLLESCLNFHSDLLRLDNIPLRPPTTAQPCISSPPSCRSCSDSRVARVLTRRHAYTIDKPIGESAVIDSAIWRHI